MDSLMEMSHTSLYLHETKPKLYARFKYLSCFDEEEITDYQMAKKVAKKVACKRANGIACSRG